jgi:serine/threonine-protein kinase RsbW
MTARRTFPCRRDAVTAARHFVRETMAGQSSETIDAAELMTSELASNCVRHAQTEFELVVRTGREIRVELHDDGEGAPMVLAPTPRQVTGRGLLIVDAMSSDWGVAPTPTGKQVWFTLPASPRSSGGPEASGASEDAQEMPAGAGRASELEQAGGSGAGPRASLRWRPRPRVRARAI